MQAIHSAPGFIYYGEREGWLIAATQAPDWGDTVQRSNFRSMARRLGESDNVAIEYTGGALGNIDYLLVRPGTPEAQLAEQLLARLDDYPVVDDDDHSALEYEEEWCRRCDSATREQHPTANCSKFRGESEIENILYAWRQRHA